MKIRDSFHTYALLTQICWALAYVYTRLGLEYFSPAPLGFLRFLTASTALLLVMVSLKIKPPKVKDLPLFILSGASGFFLHMVTFNTGAVSVTSATSSVILSTIPIITALLALLIYRETLRPYQWVAVAIEFSGILVVTLIGDSLSANAGVLWILATALCVSVFNLVQCKLIMIYSSLQVSSYSILIGTLMLTIFAPGAVREAQHAPFDQLINVMILGIVCSAVAYVSWAKAFSKAEKTSQVSNYLFISPVLTGIFGFLIAGEVPALSIVVGGVVILVGLFLFNIRGSADQSRR